jgi:hypothetical protein
MSVLKPRNRVLYFRVSEDEFQRFNHICEVLGARSISDLARSAVQNMIQDGHSGNEDPVSKKLTTLETMIRDLHSKLHQLTQTLGGPDSREVASPVTEVAINVEPVVQGE